MMKTDTLLDPPLFAVGYRLFFALATLSALALMVVWSAFFKGTLTQETYFSSHYWHAHEMLLGYSVAVVAGFLLLAARQWIGAEAISGKHLAQLALLWLYGRFVPFYEGILPNGLIAAVDFAFLPTLAYLVSKPLLKAKQYRNLIFIALLLLLCLGNGLIHSEILGLQKNTATVGIQVIMATLVILVLIVAGRILPALTHRGISAALIIRNPILDAVAIGSALLALDLPLFGISGMTLALAASLAGLANLIRARGWYMQKIWYMPLLWVLYTGYGWLIVGFFLIALSAFSVVPTSAAVHAFTLGGMGIMAVGMMARMDLGQGKIPTPLIIAFVLLNIAALFKILLPLAMPAWYNSLIYVSMLFWLAAFSFFVVVYLPKLGNGQIVGKQ